MTQPQSSGPSAIRPATMADRDALARSLSAAFYDDPLMRWVFPKDHRRADALLQIHTMELENFLRDGLVFCDAERRSAATWLPPGVKESFSPATVLRRIPAWLMASGPIRAFHALRSFGMTERLHPSEPHYYLGSVGVEPDAQGRGLGSALIEAMIPRIDADALPSYLLSSNERNLPLYERYGYVVIEEIQLPHGGPVVWPMLREAIG